MKKKTGYMTVVVVALISFLIISAGFIKTKVEQNNLEAKVGKNKTLTSTNGTDNLKQDRGKIVYSPMGDSLTEGYFATSSDKRFVEVYAKMLEDKLGYQVDVQGVAGYGGTSINGINGLEEIKSQSPDLITIEFGTNDADPANGSDIETFKANLDTMIQTVSTIGNKKPKIILVTTWNQGDKAIPFDKAIKEAGKKYDLPVADISNIWKDSSTKGPEGVQTFKGLSDNWHPNDEGMQRIAEKIYDVSENTLK